jgi:hypothetical protein
MRHRPRKRLGRVKSKVRPLKGCPVMIYDSRSGNRAM